MNKVREHLQGESDKQNMIKILNWNQQIREFYGSYVYTVRSNEESYRKFIEFLATYAVIPTMEWKHYFRLWVGIMTDIDNYYPRDIYDEMYTLVEKIYKKYQWWDHQGNSEKVMGILTSNG